MEVTSVVKQSVVLIIFYLSNVLGYGHAGLGSIVYRSGDGTLTQAPAVAGVPAGSVVVHNVPNVYNDAPSSQLHQLTLPSYSSETGYSYDSSTDGSLSSIPGLVLSLAKNTGQFVLSTLDLSDEDRHNALRRAADNVNSIIDRAAAIEVKIANLIKNIIQKLQTLPVIGYVVRLLARLGEIINYIPLKAFKAVKEILRSLLSGKSPAIYAANNAIAYAYA